MAFSILKRLNPFVSDLSERDKKELFSLAEKVIGSRIPNVKERNFIEQRIGVPINRLSDFQSFINVGSKKVWATFRACHLVANQLVSAQVSAVSVGKDGESTALDLTHPAAALLRTPNPFDSWEEITYMWTFHMKLCGTAYHLKDEVNGAGQPLGIYPLLPQYMEAVPDPKIKVSKWRYKANGTVIEMLPEEVIQYRRPHPNNLIMGLGDVEAGQDVFSTYIARGAMEEKFLENGAQPSGIMTKEEAEEDDEQWRAFKLRWNKEYGGKANAGKTAFINGKWNYHKLGLTMQEMQAIEREQWSIEQIFLIHGVPLSVAGLKDAANYATAKQDDIAFRRNECVPLMDLLIGRLNMSNGLAPAYGEDVRYTYSLSGLIDVEQVLKEYGPMVELGSLTPNQLRELCGQPRIDDPYLDQYFIKSSLVPLAMAGMSGGSAPGEIAEIVSGTATR